MLETHQQVHEHYNDTDNKDKSSKPCQKIASLILWQIIVVSPWHTLQAKDKHRNIVKKEPNSCQRGSYIGRLESIHDAKHFRPPEMKSRKKSKARPAKHNKMKMCHYKLSIMDMDISPCCTKHQAGQSANTKEIDER